MRTGAALATLLLVGCHRPADRGAVGNDAGARLERAAVAAGLVVDPALRSITGAWALDTDRACIVPAVSSGDGRIGVLVDYGEGQGCAGSGSVTRHGATLDVRLGTCRVTAQFDGERIMFPPEVPAACDRLCTGRATLAAMTVERQSESVAEARSLRTPAGGALCGS